MSKYITADSTPDLDYPWWIFDDYWGCDEWVIWHQRLKEKYGLARANEIFLKAWNDQSSFAMPYNFCKYNSGFVNYFRAQGLDAGHALSKIVTAAGNVAEGVNSTSQLIKAAMPFALIGLGAWAYFNYLKPLEKDGNNKK